MNRFDIERYKRCAYVFSQVEAKKAELWTSTFTLAEVYKLKCNGDWASMPYGQDDKFESFFTSGLVKPLLVDLQVAKISRRLCRKYSELRKPQDGIHLASCVVGNIEELHTFDVKDLIRLDGQIQLSNGKNLKISEPPAPIVDQTNIFDD